MRTTPTKKELNEVSKIHRQINALHIKEERMRRELASKYAPCKIGDIIEGGRHARDTGRVVFIEFHVWDEVHLMRIYYQPIRGKRELKTRRSFSYPETIKVIKPAQP